MRPFRVCVVVHVGEDGAGEFGAVQIGVTEIGVGQIGAGQIGTGQISPLLLGASGMRLGPK